MAGEKIANFVAYLGTLLGIIAGGTVVDAELYLSPMSYTESYIELIPYFYFTCSIVTVPFLGLRLLIKKQFLLTFGVFFIFITLVVSFMYGEEWEQTFSLVILSLLFVILLLELFFRNALIKYRLSRGQ